MGLRKLNEIGRYNQISLDRRLRAFPKCVGYRIKMDTGSWLHSSSLWASKKFKQARTHTHTAQRNYLKLPSHAPGKTCRNSSMLSFGWDKRERERERERQRESIQLSVYQVSTFSGPVLQHVASVHPRHSQGWQLILHAGDLVHDSHWVNDGNWMYGVWCHWCQIWVKTGQPTKKSDNPLSMMCLDCGY